VLTAPVTAALLIAIGSSAASAQNSERPAAATPATDQALRAVLWKQLDTNEDGILTPAEAAVHNGVASEFRKLDVNNDLKVDAKEFSAYQPASNSR
jgi:hypothetical protein